MLRFAYRWMNESPNVEAKTDESKILTNIIGDSVVYNITPTKVGAYDILVKVEVVDEKEKRIKEWYTISTINIEK